MRFRFLSVLIVMAISWSLTEGRAWCDGPYFIESGGIVSMEAENFTSNDGYVRRGNEVIWTGDQSPENPKGRYVNLTKAEYGGISGSGFMARENKGKSIHYQIKFTTTGKYYVNIRAWAWWPREGDVHNGYCPRWNGNYIAGPCPEDGVWTNKRARWGWETQKTLGHDRSGAVIVNVPSPGLYTFSIYPKREKWTWHDKIVLRHVSLCPNNPCDSTDSCMGCNSGTGPPESQRSDGPTPPKPSGPTATTGDATSVTSDSATLNGTVNPNGTRTKVKFEYGTTTNYGSSAPDPRIELDGSTDQEVNTRITGLTPDETYHFRVVATNTNNDIGTGADQTFTTANPQTIEIEGQEFTSGTTEYDATVSITFGPGVIVRSGATVILNAPVVTAVDDVTVEEGGNLVITTDQQ